MARFIDYFRDFQSFRMRFGRGGGEAVRVKECDIRRRRLKGLSQARIGERAAMRRRQLSGSPAPRVRGEVFV